jgi:hypothetical protein
MKTRNLFGYPSFINQYAYGWVGFHGGDETIGILKYQT